FACWYRSNPWMVIAAFLIAGAVSKSGLARRIAYYIASRTMKCYRSMVLVIAVLQILLGIIIPNVFARSFIIFAIVKEVCAANDVNKRDTTVLGFCVFAMSTFAGLTILTAETSLNTMLLSFLGTNVSWMGWLWEFGLPNMLITIILALVFSFVFRPSGEVKVNRELLKEKAKELGKLTKDETKILVWMVILIIFWVTDSFHGIDTTWGTLLAAGLMAVPKVGVLEPKALTEVPIGMLMYITGAMAIGSVGGATGMNSWIASVLLPSSLSNNLILVVLFITLISMVAHVVVGSAMTGMAILVPALLAFNSAQGYGYPPQLIGYIVYEALVIHWMLSFHSVPLTVGLEPAGYTDKYVLKFGTVLIPCTFILPIIVLIPWWKLIGLL
ncbi:MAG: anion permease, partial [Oscillospiraceae bacterium]|nr:anion permease [Oscillospiraceae bacterium]